MTDVSPQVPSRTGRGGGLAAPWVHVLDKGLPGSLHRVGGTEGRWAWESPDAWFLWRGMRPSSGESRGAGSLDAWVPWGDGCMLGAVH